jgi:hypothetical protein
VLGPRLERVGGQRTHCRSFHLHPAMTQPSQESHTPTGAISSATPLGHVITMPPSVSTSMRMSFASVTAACELRSRLKPALSRLLSATVLAALNDAGLAVSLYVIGVLSLDRQLFDTESNSELVRAHRTAAPADLLDHSRRRRRAGQWRDSAVLVLREGRVPRAPCLHQQLQDRATQLEATREVTVVLYRSIVDTDPAHRARRVPLGSLARRSAEARAWRQRARMRRHQL